MPERNEIKIFTQQSFTLYYANFRSALFRFRAYSGQSWVCLTSQSTFLVLRKKNAVFLFWGLIIRASPPYSTTLNQMRKNIITQCQLWDSAWKNSKVWKLFNVVCNANLPFCNTIFFKHFLAHAPDTFMQNQKMFSPRIAILVLHNLRTS